MNTCNASTGFSPFQLHLGRSPRLIPPLSPDTNTLIDTDPDAHALIDRLEADVLEARDALLAAKVTQATAANQHRADEPKFSVGDRVLLATKNRRREYLQKGKRRVAKFMPRFDGPYTITDMHPETSTYTLDLPQTMNIYPTFHVSQLRAYQQNDPSLFPNREQTRPGAIVTAEGSVECFIDKIVDERRRGRGTQYLVRWQGEGPEADEWLPRREMEETEALDIWLGEREVMAS
jgi:hypothetical protein